MEAMMRSIILRLPCLPAQEYFGAVNDSGYADQPAASILETLMCAISPFSQIFKNATLVHFHHYIQYWLVCYDVLSSVDILSVSIDQAAAFSSRRPFRI